MSQLFHLGGDIGFTAAFTGADLFAVFGAGGIFRHSAACDVVTQCGDGALLYQNRLAAAAVLSFGESVFGTGGFLTGINLFSVAQSFPI